MTWNDGEKTAAPGDGPDAVDAVSGATAAVAPDAVDGVSRATVAVASDAAEGASETAGGPSNAAGAPGAAVDFSDNEDDVPDATTGATPGVASACAELGLSSVDEVVRLRGIKPPGVA